MKKPTLKNPASGFCVISLGELKKIIAQMSEARPNAKDSACVVLELRVTYSELNKPQLNCSFEQSRIV